MIELLKKVPGVVVLHDFFLGHLVEHASLLTKEYIYDQHGFRALLDYDKDSLLWNYPLNKDILNTSLHIIVHSEYVKSLAKSWFDTITDSKWSVIPLIQSKKSDKKTLLSKLDLGFCRDDFIVCSFGLLAESKNSKEIIEAWCRSDLSLSKKSHLVFVGEANSLEYLETLKSYIQKARYPQNIHLTSWVDYRVYESYLSICDIALQLRSNSRGESSAALLDALNHSIPTIANAHGSTATIPKDILYMLKDDFSLEDLTLALDRLYTAPSKREALSKMAYKFIDTNHSPNKIALEYKEAIEKAYRSDMIGGIKQNTNIEDIVKTIALSAGYQVRHRQILVDISSIIKVDLKTGIQRVVRSTLIELVKNSPKNWRVEAVYLDYQDGEYNYFYAREYMLKLLGIGGVNIYDEVVDIDFRDIFYGLDLVACEVDLALKHNIYKTYKDMGVKIIFMVYDLLPITNPEFFPDGSKDIHQKWFENIIKVSDTLIAISASVASEIKKFTKDKDITYVHLGADISTLPLVRVKVKKPTFLIVGTIEPRKGHSQVLEAFERLWREGMDIDLVIVGKEGWMVEEFMKRLTNHRLRDKNLFYLKNIDDKTLQEYYLKASAIIVASYAEGFGLPLIEAALYGTPIIARDIPVFKEVASTHAYYFKDTKSPKLLSLQIKEWLELYSSGTHPKPQDMPYFTWEESVQKLLKILD
jgi:glycosyltransferase involved in cell wall biosynthesis